MIRNSLTPDESLPPETDLEKTDLSLLQQAELERLKEENKQLAENREMRREYANKAYSFAKYTISGWGILIFVYVLAINPKPISETALGIITTGCTVNILVAFHAVIKGLFSQKE